jgi:hypothetical protein
MSIYRPSGYLLLLLALLCVPACDNDPGANGTQTMFRVRYEAEGVCASIISVGYTTDLGSTAGESITLPWSFEKTIDTSGATATSPAAVGLAVSCLGTPGANNMVTARVFVDGVLEDEKTTSGDTTFIVSVSATLR